MVFKWASRETGAAILVKIVEWSRKYLFGSSWSWLGHGQMSKLHPIGNIDHCVTAFIADLEIPVTSFIPTQVTSVTGGVTRVAGKVVILR